MEHARLALNIKLDLILDQTLVQVRKDISASLVTVI